MPTRSAIWSKTLNCSPRDPPDPLYEALLSALDALLPRALCHLATEIVDVVKLGGRKLWKISHVLSYTPIEA